MRSLRLKTERLAELTTDDLTSIAGAQQALTYGICATLFCPSYQGCTTAQSCGCSPTWNCQ